MAAKRCQATKRQRSGQHQRSLSKPKLEKSALSLSEVSRAYRRHHLKGERKKLQGLHLDDQLGERTTAAAGGRQQTWGCPRVRLPLSPPLTASSVFSLQQQTRLLEEGVRRRKRRTRKPSKYTCRFSSRACVRCGFLQKRICSHARERPLRSCSPCESRFESKGNLREHRKSRIRRPELGLSDTAVDHSGVQAWQLMENQKGFMEASSLGSEYKPKQLGFLSSALEEPAERALQKSSSIAPSRAADAQGLMDSQRMEEAHAVKQRLVMRLSERKRTPVDASDEGLACTDPWSKGSTESGYFSRSESSELPQTSPPNSEAKSYAEIILGKFGRVDQGPRNAHQQYHRCSEPERRRIPLNVPATQVIEHITKLITINEALVDTREIDSVKPRRSLSRKNSLELPRALKAPCAYHPKGDTPGSGSASSVDVKCLRNNLHPRFLNADSRPRRASPVPLLRSRSMPSSASAAQPPTPRFRSSHSFDERQAAPAGKRAGHHHGMLRRQRALEAPFEPDIVLQGMAPYYSSTTTVLCGPWQPTTRDSCPREPETCIPCFGNRNVPEEHVLSSEVLPAEDAKRKACNEYYSRALPDVLCKKQKEDGKELEECLSNARLVLSSLSPTSSFKIERNATFEKLSSKANVMLLRSDGRSIGKGISVIQHTSSFERSGKTAAALTSDRGHQPPPIELPQPPSSCHLMRQHSIEVPEVLLAEDADSNIASGTSLESLAVTHAKESEKFQYPQRSVTLAQFPAEKLPPKKKRLCLNEPQTSEVPGAQREFFNYRCLPSQGYSAAYEGGHIYPLGKQATFGACDKKVLPSGTGEIILPAKSNVNPVSPREPNRPTLSAELSQNEPPLRLSPVSPPPDALAQPRTGSILSVSSTQRVLSVSQCPVPSLVSLTTRSVVPLRHRVFPFQPVRDLGESGAALGSPDPTSLRPAADVHRQDTKSSPPPSLSLIPILCVDQHACPTDLSSSELSTHMNPTTIPVRTQNAFPLYGKGLYTSQSVGVVQKNQGCLQIKLEEQSHLNPCVEPCISGVRDNLSWTPPLKPSAPLEREVTGSRSKKRALSQAGSVEFFPDKEPQPKRVKNEDEGNDDCVGERPIEEGESKQDKVIKEPTLMCERKKEEKTQKVKLNEHTESEFRESEPSKEKGHKNNHLRTMDSSHTNETLNSCISTATMVSWCYLKYLNPSCNRDLQNPGCSSWSSYLPSPNLPGFSTRLALSLLCSKQKQRPEVYTVASMIQPAAEQLVPATKTQRSEVQGSATMSSSSAVVRERAEETEERSSENEATST